MRRIRWNPCLWRICPRFRRPVRQIGGKTRRPLIHPQKDRWPGKGQHRVTCRNPSQVLAYGQGLAPPDRQHRSPLQRTRQSVGIPPQSRVPVQARTAKGYRFRDALSELMNLARLGNKYFNDAEPWKTQKSESRRGLARQRSPLLPMPLQVRSTTIHYLC